ncbi:hypothetical protein C0993_009989 [Termitomyces sp. T159_Od127]|nr:hypothetical protein C0993_009989 [Termitomyces sp. T159_Od127]
MIPQTPTSRNRVPAIDTDIAHDHNISIPSPTPISNNDASPVHFLQTGASPTSPITPRTQSNAHKVNPINRARTESRKLLAHVLDQLHHRTLPPGIFEAFNHTEVEGPEDNLGLLLQTVKGAVVNPKKMRQDGKHHVPTGVGEDDSDEDGEREFSTDATYDLMLQLKDLLRVSMDWNWHILDDDSYVSPQHE